MASSDRPFKLVHAHPRMVEDVVRFVAPQWADRLDYEALVAVDKEYVAREQRNREALQALVQDKVWRAPVKEGQPLANGERPYMDILLEYLCCKCPRRDCVFTYSSLFLLCGLRSNLPGSAFGCFSGGGWKREGRRRRLVAVWRAFTRASRSRPDSASSKSRW